MPAPHLLLRSAAEALLDVHGARLAEPALTLLTLDIVQILWRRWARERDEEQRKADLLGLSTTPPAEMGAEIERLLTVAAGQPEPVRRAIATYLHWLPKSARQALRQVDPQTAQLGHELLLQQPEDLLQFLPARLPRFKLHDVPLPGVDLELTELLGVGGFGEVWKANNPHFEGMPPVALKFCRDPEARDRLLRHEASVLSRVMRQGKHPGIVPLLRTYLTADPPCLEYEFVEGGDLGELVQGWRWRGEGTPPELATRIVQRLADIVGFAHRVGPPIVHRDLKPANVLVNKTGENRVQFRIADFGIGGLAARQAIEETTNAGAQRGQFLPTAMRGAFTPLYSSPQQIRGEPPDPRDDVYSLGVIWYQLLVGDLAAGRPGGRHWAHRLAARGLREELVDLLASCLEDAPEDRPPDARALAEALGHGLRGETPPPDDDLASHVQRTLHQAGRSQRRARQLAEEEHDYEAAAKVLEEMPGDLRDSGLYAIIVRSRDDVVRLSQDIQEAVRSNQFSGLKAKVAALLELQPHRADMRRLLEALVPVADLPPVLVNSIGMRLTLLPAGSFLMGSPESEPERSPREGPVHEVRFAKPFYLGILPVTQREYEAVMGVNPAYFSPLNGGTPEHPVEQVSWDDAAEYCRRLSALPEEKRAWRLYRLPTEAEWEYACRAGATTACPRGPSIGSDEANFNGGFPYGNAVKGPNVRCTTRAGVYPPNAFGLYDMLGNVWEWCADYYGLEYYEKSPRDAPEGPSAGSYRVLRGGSWYTSGRSCRCACRNMALPDRRVSYVGFRVLLTPGMRTG